MTLTEISKVTDLILDEHNANLGTDRGKEMLAKSLKEYGAGRSILVDKEGRVIAGNKTLAQAIEAGIEDLLVVKTDGNQLVAVKRVDLDLNDGSKARELAYADNRTSEVGLDWNPGQLLADLEGGLDLSGLFGKDELDELLKGLVPEPPEDPGPQIDRAAELQEKWGTAAGQIWQLGEHRLACIDSTDIESVAMFMQGVKAGLFATDPPYGANAGNIGYTAQRDNVEAITKDDLESVEMQAFLERAFQAWIPHLADNCAWYLWHPMLTQGYFAAAAAAADLIISRQIIWRKEQFIFGRGDYHWRHELCFYGWRKGNRPAFYGERNQDTIWEIPYDGKRSEIGHPTAKPVKLFAIPIANHLKRGEVCTEPFCGSGSQIVAAEQASVRCFAAEIEPKYCAVTIQRWVDMTGGEPQLIASNIH